jgi:diguanylate cyclase (GGDEF)-like protein
MTGKSGDELAGEDVSVALNLRDRDSNKLLKLPVNDAVDSGITEQLVRLRGSCILLRENGKQRDIEYSVAPIFDPSRRISGSIVVLQDTTEARRLNSKLTYQALHDGLTGLYNRSEFDRRLRSLLSRTYEEDDLLHGLLYMDLDQFKVVNDSCGHMAGDELLRQISERLQQRIRPGDTLARLGGDEFGVLINVSTAEQINSIANELREEVEDFRFVWDNKTFTLGVSIGMVMIDRYSENPDILLSMADRACYAAKESGRNKVRLYQPNDIEMLRRNRDTQWVSKLRDAMRSDGLQLAMQRIVPVNSETRSGEIYEILVGMLNARGERISASSFLPAAERYTLMPELDRWIVSHVFSWLSRNPTHLEHLEHCMINLSGQTLNDDNFPGYVLAQMERKGIPPKKICFEITETAAISNLARTAELIKALKSEGCSFALDDFGSGMSSYTYLKYLPVDYIKIDGVFVRDIVKDRIDRAMVQSINDIGHIMGKRTIAEYVENQQILALLNEIGVDYAQGFGIARPLPLTDFEAPGGRDHQSDQ